MIRPVYQKVTKDEFQLVLAQADTIAELARITGVTKFTICHAIKEVEAGTRKNSCWQITWINDEEEDE